MHFAKLLILKSTLYGRDMIVPMNGDNSSKQLDGRYNDYFLREKSFEFYRDSSVSNPEIIGYVLYVGALRFPVYKCHWVLPELECLRKNFIGID